MREGKEAAVEVSPEERGSRASASGSRDFPAGRCVRSCVPVGRPGPVEVMASLSAQTGNGSGERASQEPQLLTGSAGLGARPPGPAQLPLSGEALFPRSRHPQPL